MGHSAKFEKVKKYYNSGLWSKTAVVNAVGKWITENEAAEILGVLEPEDLDVPELTE